MVWCSFNNILYLISRTPTKILDYKSPFEVLFGLAPDYSFLKTFGVVCYPCLSHSRADKLSPKSVRCIFIGYSILHKGYKCYNPTTKKLHISRNIMFDESQFYFTHSTSDFTPITGSDSCLAFKLLLFLRLFLLVLLSPGLKLELLSQNNFQIMYLFLLLSIIYLVLILHC